MSEDFLIEILRGLPIGPMRYFDSIGSTNDQAARWADDGAPHLSLVVADEQTAGRGRLGRRWFTPAGAALAFSLILRPEMLHSHLTLAQGLAKNGYVSRDNGLVAIPRLTALGTVAVCSALHQSYRLTPLIKWPNDVLLNGCKTCGVLAEAHWQAERLQAVILGVGINVAKDSLPLERELLFPATCLEAVLGRPVDRWELLYTVLERALHWLPRLGSAEFLSFWEDHLAFRGEQVHLFRDGSPPVDGLLQGLDEQGSLRLSLADGSVVAFQSGEIHLRPLTG